MYYILSGRKPSHVFVKKCFMETVSPSEKELLSLQKSEFSGEDKIRLASWFGNNELTCMPTPQTLETTVLSLSWYKTIVKPFYVTDLMKSSVGAISRYLLTRYTEGEFCAFIQSQAISS